jgi:hypothetical protein
MIVASMQTATPITDYPSQRDEQWQRRQIAFP